MVRIMVVGPVDTVRLVEDMAHLLNKGADTALSLLQAAEDMELLLQEVDMAHRQAEHPDMEDLLYVFLTAISRRLIGSYPTLGLWRRFFFTCSSSPTAPRC